MTTRPVKTDPIAVALDSMTRGAVGGQTMRIDLLFGDRPQVLESIRKARADRRLSYRQIANALSTPDARVSAGAVKTWLLAQGIDT